MGDWISNHFINMLSWPQWLLLSAVPPAIIALYFLKLKRQPLEVPSTYLWRKSIEDLHVNSIWQRLRQSLLLYLQLLVLLLLIMSLIRPHWKSTALIGDRFVFLVDNSASMSATDVSPTRLEEAKRQVIELIDQMKSTDRAMVISFADGAQVVQEFSDNRRQLRRRVEDIKPTERTTSLVEALHLASGLANPGRTATEAGDVAAADALPATIYIYSDGRFPAVQGFSLGNLKPVYVPVGEPGAANVAITAFSTRRHETKIDVLQAFFQLENFGPAPAEVEVTLARDGQFEDAKRVRVEPGKPAGDVFALANPESGMLKLTLKHADPLALDNVAYAAINAPRRGRMLFVSPGNDAIEWSLATSRAKELADVEIRTPDFLDSADYQRLAAAGAYDVVIYDQCRPKAMPQANTVFIGRLPLAGPAAPGEKAAEVYSPWSPAKTEGDVSAVNQPQIIDTDRNHPLMQLVELGDMFIGKSLLLEPPQGATVLIDSTGGKLMAIAPRGGFEDVVIGFEIITVNAQGERFFNTDWWRRRSFPTFWLNVLSYLAGGQTAQATTSVRPGEIHRLRAQSQVERVEVRKPDGGQQTVIRGKRNDFNFSETEQVGIYEVREGNAVSQRFAVNLFDGAESNIAPRVAEDDPIQIGYVDIQADTSFEPARSELWKPLLILALAIVALEWYVYNRRVYI